MVEPLAYNQVALDWGKVRVRISPRVPIIMVRLSTLKALIQIIEEAPSCSKGCPREQLEICEHCEITVHCSICNIRSCQCWNDE